MNNYLSIFLILLLSTGFQREYHHKKKIYKSSLISIKLSSKASTSVLNTHDENFFGYTADRYDWTNHPCHRDCNQYEKPKTCHYVFVVEHYYAMSSACYDCPLNMTDCFRPHCIPTDGVEKPVYVVNRQLPGPIIEVINNYWYNNNNAEKITFFLLFFEKSNSIKVCEQDNIEVDVRNRMLSESTTIHWHGFKQRGTPYMDGVPYVSQCPLLPGENFRYVFKASDPGTFFYHSHIGRFFFFVHNHQIHKIWKIITFCFDKKVIKELMVFSDHW